jgi:hypothetical protein
MLATRALPRNHRGFAQSLVWRGCGQNMNGIPNTVSAGGGAWSSCLRSRNYSPIQFRYFRVVLPTFWCTGSTIIDTNLPYNCNFQVGFEYPFNNSFTGIATRQTVTFSSANSASYTTSSGPFGYIMSDIMDAGSFIPSNTFFGIWTTVENVGTNNDFPATVILSDDYQAGWERYTGIVNASSSLITSGQALTASSITQASTSQAGGQTAYCPAFLLIEHEPNYKSVLLIGDCIGAGIDEGQAGSGVYGDTLGSALGNVGYPMRYVIERLGYNGVNFSKASDGFHNYSATNWKYRLPLFALANPTHFLCQFGNNDVNLTPATVQTDAQALFAGLRATVPGRPIIQCTIGPRTTSTDNFATLVNQTVSANFGNSSSNRGQINAAIRSLAWGHNGFIDHNPVVENGYSEGVTASETSVWVVNGSANYMPVDGEHANSYAYQQGAANLYASRNGSTTSDPFTP